MEEEKYRELYSAKSDLISVSAHQIRTSLAAQKWIMKMFLDGDLGKLTTEQESLLRKAYEGNDRAIEIVSELLITNKNENLTEKAYILAPVNLVKLIEDTIFDFSGEAYNRGIEIIFLKAEMEDSVLVHADQRKLRVVIENLLDNAIKYSNLHGKIFVSMSRDGDSIQVAVKDTGVGISEEGKKKIFEKFYRDPAAEHKERIGSGIGLFTAKKIVEAQGGKIWFDSREKEGTTFFFTIPISL